MAEILQKAQRDIMYKAIDAVQERNDQINKLLQNGMEIYLQSTGDRFTRLSEQRSKLWMKMFENSKIIGLLWDIAQTECIKY